MLEQPAVFLDLETTGATATHDRITEIGIVAIEGGRLAEEWSTLVNPEMRIPPAIQALTGISERMVEHAPTFAQVMEELLARIEGRLLIAHNARFDYGFLRNEFKRHGVRYQSKVLCTVKLSRRLFPQHHRHNLDTLIERHGLACSDRHRALGDARVLWHLLQTLYRELPAADIEAAVEAIVQTPTVPAGLDEGALDALPEGPGVYLFYGENDAPLYVGKSVQLRARVLSHFASDHRVNKDMRIARQVRRVECIETAGELGALLHEARLVKELAPLLNRRLRRNHELCAFRCDPRGGAPELLYARESDFAGAEALYGPFKSRREALDTLRHLADEHGLCPLILGLEPGKGPCFAHQLKKCKGACAGKESLKAHGLRLMSALGRLRMKPWPFKGRIGIREAHTGSGRTEVHVLERWCHLATARSEEELREAAASPARPVFDFDTYKILLRYFEKHRRPAVIEL